MSRSKEFERLIYLNHSSEFLSPAIVFVLVTAHYTTFTR